MPAAPRHVPPPPLIQPGRVRLSAGVLVVAVAVLGARGQPPEPPGKSADPSRASAFKLPDGTVIFFSKSPDEANPPVDGVLLSPQEYKALVEQAEQLKKLKAGPQLQAPSGCQIRGRIESRGDRMVAALSLTYAIRTTQPRTPIALGGHQAFPLAARLDSDKLPPILGSSEAGLTALIEHPGDHTLTLDVEVPVAMRGMGRELGFELTLPRAAITTLAINPPAGVARVTVGVRTAADRPGELTLRTGDPAAVAGRPEKPVPLGPVDAVVMSWETPASQAAGSDLTTSAEHDVVVRVDDVQIETTAKIRLRGSAREWVLALPVGSDVAASRVSSPAARDPQSPADPGFGSAGTGPTLVRPTDPARSVWTFRPPDDPGPDWELTVTHRQPRPKAGTPSHPGPYRVGPFSVQNAARQTGTVKLFAPPTIKLREFRTAPELRRPDLPPAEDSLVALFRFTASGSSNSKATPAPLLQFEARQVPGFVRVQPTYELARTEAGWRLRLTARITPIRTELEQVVVDVPPGWEGVEAGPAELVDEVQVATHPGPMRRLALGLLAPQKGAFDLTLTAAFAVPSGAREATLPLPRFPNATESGGRVLATVPEPLEVRGTAFADGPAGGPVDLHPTSPSTTTAKAVTRATDPLDRGVTRVHLTWHPYRPELMADVQAEVGVQDRQAVISQVVRFRSAESDTRPIRLKGPPGLSGLRASPPLEPTGPGEWLVHPPQDSKGFTLTLSYALAIPARRPDQPGPIRFPVGLLWPESATRVESTVRVWGAGTGRRVERFEGPWRELPPEPAVDRDSLPWLTLAGTGSPVPLTLEISDPGDGVSPGATVDRSFLQAWIAEDGAVAIRSRFVLRRWSASGIDLDYPSGLTPTILIDDRKVEPAILAVTADGVTRVRLPVPAGTAGRSPLRLDVRYQSTPVRSLRGDIWQVTCSPPRLSAATYTTSPRWQIVYPAPSVPLFFGRELTPEYRFAWRHSTFGPVAGATTDELEQWIRDGNEPDAEGDDLLSVVGTGGGAFTARQPALGPVRMVLVPRGWWMTGVSLVVLVLGLGLSRIRPTLLGPVAAVLGVATAVLAIGWPQPAAEVVAAAQPGLVLLVSILATVALFRWYYRQRVLHLPGFARGRAEFAVSSATGSAHSGPRSSQNGPAAVREESGRSPPLAPTGS